MKNKKLSNTPFSVTLYNEYNCLKIGAITFDDVTPSQLERALTEIKDVLCEINFPTCAEIISYGDLSKSELRKLESAKQRVARLEEINHIKK